MLKSLYEQRQHAFYVQQSGQLIHGGEGATSTSSPLEPRSRQENFLDRYMSPLRDWAGRQWFLACMLYLFFTTALLLGYFRD